MLILGSKSPRRREILKFFNLPFKQVSPAFDEESISTKLPPAAFVCKNAKFKALSIAKKYKNQTILTADTIVYLKGRIYGKPKSRAEATIMLKELSGRCHFVYTGVCVLKAKKCLVKWAKTKVCFYPLSENEIERYLSCFHFWDKAGSYAVQKGSYILIKSLDGCFYNVMGLPIGVVRELLKEVGMNLWDFLKPHA